MSKIVHSNSSKWKTVQILGIIALLSTSITACGTSQTESHTAVTHTAHDDSHNDSTGKIEHNHGIAFSSDGTTLFLAEHDGLRPYQNNAWQAPLNPHDLMGFAATQDATYVSGHPGDATLKNPFGLAKLANGGKTIQPLSLYGKDDFHEMAASYKKGTIYVENDMNVEGIKKGLNYTQDNGAAWTAVQGDGIEGKIQAMAVHPTDDSIVAIGTENGLFLSKDHGNHFTQIVKNSSINGLQFSMDETSSLYVGSYENGPVLYRMDMANNQKTQVKLPFSGQDTVTFLTQNPKNMQQLAIATFKNKVFLSNDKGEDWKALPLD